jgi:hypothetical protein
MANSQMSKWQKVLSCWSALALGAAEYIRHLHLSDRTEMLVGAAEILVAVLTGIAFGIAAIGRNNNSDSFKNPTP